MKFHKSPKGYSYQFEVFNTKLIAIWLIHSFSYSYTKKSIKTIWGFYSPKKNEYYAPIHSQKCGKKVNLSETTCYSAMIPKRTVLEECYV